MENKLKAINKNLKIYYFAIVLLAITAFVTVLYYVTGNNIPPVEDINLERFAIILTLFGIPFSLWYFHTQLKKADKQNTDNYLKKYRQLFLIRLAILFFVCSFNIVFLYITGAKNFIFMNIITIFAFFLCFPQKELERPENNDESL